CKVSEVRPALSTPMLTPQANWTPGGSRSFVSSAWGSMARQSTPTQVQLTSIKFQINLMQTAYLIPQLARPPVAREPDGTTSTRSGRVDRPLHGQSQSVPQQLYVQPVEHRRTGYHEQLPGRRRHPHPRLGT